MNDLTPAFERESGLVILKGRPSGVGGEAPLTPVPGLSLAFDRVDGQLCRAIVTTCETAGFTGVSEQVAEMLVRLFGAEALGVLADAARSPREASRAARVLCPEPGLTGTLSSLARLDAARATSPVPADSPWWAAEAAELAQRVGLAGRARAEAHRALVKLVGQLGRLEAAMLPEQAVRAARTVAAINAATEPAAAGRLRAALVDDISKWSPRLGVSGPRLATPTRMPVFDVAAEVENLDKDRLGLIGVHWMVDPRWVQEGLFQAGLSPHSDLFVRCDGTQGRITVEALLAPGADYAALSGYQVRLVDPSVRRVLAQAGFTIAQSHAQASIQPKFPLDELVESWIEVVPASPWHVRSAKMYRVRRALRWADAALRAERTPAVLAPASAREDWAALAAVAWERCRCDWAAVGAADRAQAARRRAAIASRAYDPRAPSAAAAEVPCQVRIDGPAYLAEILGS